MVSQSQTKPLFNFLVYIYVYDVSTCYSYIELRIERNFLGFSRYYFSTANKKKCENHTLKSKNWWVCYVVYFSNSFFCLSEGRQLGPIQVWFSSYSSHSLWVVVVLLLTWQPKGGLLTNTSVQSRIILSH